MTPVVGPRQQPQQTRTGTCPFALKASLLELAPPGKAPVARMPGAEGAGIGSSSISVHSELGHFGDVLWGRLFNFFWFGFVVLFYVKNPHLCAEELG